MNKRKKILREIMKTYVKMSEKNIKKSILILES